MNGGSGGKDDARLLRASLSSIPCVGRHSATAAPPGLRKTNATATIYPGYTIDRRYSFTRDGDVSFMRGGFVAGNLATSYLMVVGPDDPAVTARYRFEDYALILESDDGIERQFIAVPESAEQPLPDTLIIGGSAFWLDED